MSSRPKRLLVVINPESGSRSGEKIYYNKVAPLFKQANIETEVIGKDSVILSNPIAARRRHHGLNKLIFTQKNII